MFVKLKKNDHGIVFVTVLMIILVGMVLAVSAMSLNISQVKTAEDELRHIQAELIAEGALAQVQIDRFSAAPSNTINYNETLGFSQFGVNTNINVGGPAPAGSNSDPLSITVTFP